MRHRTMERLREIIRRLLADPRSRLVLTGAGSAAAVLLASVAHASGGGGHGEPHLNLWTWDDHAPPVGWFLLDAILFFAALAYFTRKPLAEMFRRRHEAVKEAIDAAQAALAKAQSHQAEYAAKLARVEGDIQGLTDGAKADGAAERDRIVTEAKGYAERMRKDTTSIAGQEEEAARRRLRREAVDTVLERARVEIHSELTDADRQRLIEEAIVALESGSGALAATHEPQRRAG